MEDLSRGFEALATGNWRLLIGQALESHCSRTASPLCARHCGLSFVSVLFLVMKLRSAA